MGNTTKGSRLASTFPPEIADAAPQIQLAWLERPAALAAMTRTSIKRLRKTLRDRMNAPAIAGEYSPAPQLHRLCCSPAWADDCAAHLRANSQARIFDGMKRALAEAGFYPPANDHPAPARATKYDRFTNRRHPLRFPASALVDRSSEMRLAKFTLNTRRRGKVIQADQFEQGIMWPAIYIDGAGRTFDRQLLDIWRSAGKVYSEKKPTSDSPSAQGIAALGIALTHHTAADVGADPESFAEQQSIAVVLAPAEEDFPEDTAALVREIRLFNKTGMTADTARNRIKRLIRNGRDREAAALRAEMNGDCNE